MKQLEPLEIKDAWPRSYVMEIWDFMSNVLFLQILAVKIDWEFQNWPSGNKVAGEFLQDLMESDKHELSQFKQPLFTLKDCNQQKETEPETEPIHRTHEIANCFKNLSVIRKLYIREAKESQIYRKEWWLIKHSERTANFIKSKFHQEVTELLNVKELFFSGSIWHNSK